MALISGRVNIVRVGLTVSVLEGRGADICAWDEDVDLVLVVGIITVAVKRCAWEV